MHPYVVKFVQQLVIRGRSSKTIDGYTQSLCYFLKRLKGRTPSSITIADINDYQHYLATVKKRIHCSNGGSLLISNVCLRIETTTLH